MSDLEELTPVVSHEEGQDEGTEKEKDDGSRAGGRIRTESEGYGITEEQEKTLLAGEDDEDKDIIELQCLVKDFDSDMEEEFRRKDAIRVEIQQEKAGTGTEKEAVDVDTVELQEVVRIVHTAENEEPMMGLGEEVADDDDDQDVIQIEVENEDDLLEEVPTGGKKAEKLPDVSAHGSDATKNERILSKPLVKQVVMDVSGVGGRRAEDEFKDQNGAVGSPKNGQDDRTEPPMGTQEDSDDEQPLVIADSVGTMSAHHQEDPDVLQLKLDLQQNLGEMVYESDDDDHRDPLKDDRADNEEQLERRIQIKEEPMSPVRDQPERILLEIEGMDTIVLSSDDDIVAPPRKEHKKLKKGKKKNKKKKKQRTKSESSAINYSPITVEDSLPTISSKSLHSTESMIMDEALIKTGFRMELRKRKSATHLEECRTPSPTSKRRIPVKKSDDCRRSKSRGSISENFLPDKHAKKTSAQQPIFQPISTADKLKSNSLFADCEKPEVVPTSFLDDGVPLLDKHAKDTFEKVFKSHPPVKKHAQLPTRQTMLIDALPAASSHVKSVHKSGNEPSPRKSKSTQKPKVVPEIMHSLENDLAMSSSDEEAPLQSFLGSAMIRSPAPKKPGRKRGRATKQRFEDYFGSSPSDRQGSQPTETTPARDDKKVKRRKKRSRPCSSSSNSEDETTVTESISLAGTNSTITTARSVTAREEEDDEQQQQVKPDPPKTEEMRVVLSPLTDERIEKLSKCNTPKKARSLSKASQTELEGLTWRIDLGQIDFHSEYFEKLYQLIKNGRERSNNNSNNFDGVVMVGRDAVRPPTPPERSPQRPPAAANGRARSDVERLLFEHLDEVEFVTAPRVDPAARVRMERSIRSNFRIPKIAKQPSRSPQDVTSSTQHDNDDENRRSTSGSGYSNDRHVAPEPRRHITIGNRSPVGISNRPEVAAPAATGGSAGNNNRPLAPIRRTIRNDNVQQQPLPPQPQPIEHGFPTYGPPEQRQPQPPQYRASSGGNLLQQQHPQLLQQQQPSQLGSYSASGQEMDVKPTISALGNPAGMLGTGFMNNRFIDSIHLVCQLTMMQMQQQQLQFPAMNALGQMFAGPSVVPIAAANNPAMAPPAMPSQMMQQPSTSAGPRFVGVPDAGGHLDEVSDQISQIFGCIDYLKGRCIKNPCHYSHTLPVEADLRQTLLDSAQEVVMTTYQFIVGQDELFLRYFPVYAKVMGRRNMRHQLLDAVPHCEQSKRAFSHYRYIVDGLSINGTLTRSKAVQLVLERHRKIDFGQINVLIGLILDTGDDVPQFLQSLEEFSQVPNYSFEIPSINKLLAFCVRASRTTNKLLHGTVADVAKLTYGLVMKVATGKEPFVDTDSLFKYTTLLMKSNLGLDHDKIQHKYGKNELGSSAASL